MITATELKLMIADCDEKIEGLLKEIALSKTLKNKVNAKRSKAAATRVVNRRKEYIFCHEAIQTMSADNIERQRNELRVKMTTINERAFNQVWANQPIRGYTAAGLPIRNKPDIKEPGTRQAIASLTKAYDYNDLKKQWRLLNFILR